MLKVLAGPNKLEGPYHHLSTLVAQYDVAALYSSLVQLIDQPTIVSQARELDALFMITFKQGQEIFSYLTEIRKQVKRIKDMNLSLDQGNAIEIPESFVRAKLILAYIRPLIDKLLVDPDSWSDMTVDTIYKQLQHVTVNSRDMARPSQTSQGQSSPSSGPRDVAVANSVQAARPKMQDGVAKKKGLCFAFVKTGVCDRNDCKFEHTKPSAGGEQRGNQPARGQSSRPQASVPANNQPLPINKQVCSQCGGVHARKECRWTGKCNHCGKSGHKELVCHQKKAGKPRALNAEVAENGVQANLVRVKNLKRDRRAKVFESDADFDSEMPASRDPSPSPPYETCVFD